VTTLATQADLEAYRGPAYLDELLREAYKSSDSQPVKDALAAARLQTALNDGDVLIRQFLEVGFDWTAIDQDTKSVLLPFARDEAIYKLKVGSRAGTDKEDEDQAQRRRLDLAKMRDRKQWPGSSATQQPTRSEVVESGSRFRYDRLEMLI
jgi:hypothetical protein